MRAARRSDVARIGELVRELAAYEKLGHEVVIDPRDLEEHLFGARPVCEALVAEADGDVVGFALFFQSYSTFLGRPGLYLEDLFVRPAFRGRGLGKALLASVAKLAVDRRCGRFEWAVLDWNAPAIAFYRALGATPMDGWTVHRVTGAALTALASKAPPIEVD